jgi:hypothetical protein
VFALQMTGCFDFDLLGGRMAEVSDADGLALRRP